MRRILSVLVALVPLYAATVSAQAVSRAELVLTILGGATSGHSLWSVPVQPLAVLDTAGRPTGVEDTIRLSRELTSSIVIGASATYFFSPHLGVHAEISYLGLPFDDSCAGTFHTDSEQKNQRACDDVQSRSGAGGSVSLFVGATLRASSRALTPYARVNVGLVGQPHSSVEVIGNYFTRFGPQPIHMIDDPSPRHAAPLVGLALGLTTPVDKGGGYQFRLEVRDLITSVERVTGPADATTLIAPTASRAYHHLGLTIGLDIVLEKKRGRRY